MSAHQEVPIKLTAWIDQGVVPLVEALDDFEDVLTVASCEDDGTQGAYVLFRLRGTSDQATDFASALAADFNSEPGASYLLQAEWRPGESQPLLTLSCPPDQVPLLASLINSSHARASEDDKESTTPGKSSPRRVPQPLER
jgi:hypothetical protein